MNAKGVLLRLLVVFGFLLVAPVLLVTAPRALLFLSVACVALSVFRIVQKRRLVLPGQWRNWISAGLLAVIVIPMALVETSTGSDPSTTETPSAAPAIPVEPVAPIAELGASELPTASEEASRFTGGMSSASDVIVADVIAAPDEADQLETYYQASTYAPAAAEIVEAAARLGLVPAQVVRVIDGDTIVVSLANVEERVRLIGVDSPERGAPGFNAATAFTQQAIDDTGGVVYLARNGADRDRFDRLRRKVWLGVPANMATQRSELLLNQKLLDQGHAVVWGGTTDTPASAPSAPSAPPAPASSAPPAPSAPAPSPETANDNIPSRFRNCTHVWEVLGRPIRAGERGFHSALDRDGDGVGCESRPRR